MTKQVQRRRGTATQHTSFTGAEGEISVNTTNKSIHVHDGVTAGGIEGARADMTNVSDGDLNSRLAGNTLSSLTITSADINGGTIDGTVIGGTTPAAGNFTTGSFTGNATFGDNDKAIFGAGSDLQIYHDGSHSWIKDVGTGDLTVSGDNLYLEKGDGTKFLYGVSSTGQVRLYYGDDQKFITTSTGIDVTGTVTADGLTVDGDVLLNGDRDLHLVGANPNAGTSFQYGEITLGDSASGQYINHAKILSNGNFANQTSLEFHTSSNNSSPLRMKIADTGDISFYEDTGTTPKFHWSASAESLGIGTSSPSEKLHVNEASTNASRIRVSNTDGYLEIGTNNQVSNLDSQTHTFRNEAGTTEYMRIDSSGNVGIGTSSPSANLHVEASGTNPYIRVTETGNTGIDFGQETNGNGLINLRDSTALRIFTGGTERMRIDSSGNVLFNGASTTAAQVSYFEAGRGSLQLKNATTAGSHVAQFSNPNGIVGQIFTSGSSTVYSTSSDYRLKTDAQPMTGASARVQALKPVNFEWIADGTRVDGFLAHEAQEVVPEAVTGTKDAVDADGNPDYQGIDQSKLVPLLTAALQEALTKIDALETRITALEG